MPSDRRLELVVSFKADANPTKLEDLDVIIGVPDEIWTDVLQRPEQLLPIIEDAFIAAVRAITPVGQNILNNAQQEFGRIKVRLIASTKDGLRIFPVSSLRADPGSKKEDLN